MCNLLNAQLVLASEQCNQAPAIAQRNGKRGLLSFIISRKAPVPRNVYHAEPSFAGHATLQLHSICKQLVACEEVPMLVTTKHVKP